MIAIAAAIAAGVGCGSSDSTDEPPPPVKPDGPEAAFVTQARATFPRAIDVHSGVIARSCSPNPGVCHNAKGYPDLTSMGALLSTIEGPCNVELPDRTQGWDNCERAPWRIEAGGFRSDVAWTEKLSSGMWRLGMRSKAPTTGSRIAGFRDATDNDNFVLPPVEQWNVKLSTTSGSTEAELSVEVDDAAQTQYIDSIIANVVGGDPNNNGVWGADDLAANAHGTLITPGSLERSYLWGRLTGTVPGTRMPLANQALSNTEYVALACWIETLAATPFPRANDPINYDDCVFAWYPVEYE